MFVYSLFKAALLDQCVKYKLFVFWVVINPSKKVSLCLIDHFSVVTVLLALNFISLESLFISLYNDAPVVMNMNLWAEPQLYVGGSQVVKNVPTVHCPVGIDSYCFELNGGLDVF